MENEKGMKNGDIYRNLVDIARNNSDASILNFIDKSCVGGPASFEADAIVSNYNKLKRLIGDTPARIVATGNCKIYELTDDIILNIALDLWFENNPEVRAKIFKKFINTLTADTILSAWHDEPAENNGLYETHVIHVSTMDGVGYLSTCTLEYYTGFNLESFFNCYDDFYNIAPLGRYIMKEPENYQDGFFDQCDKYREKGMSVEDYIYKGAEKGKFNLPDNRLDEAPLREIEYEIEDYCANHMSKPGKSYKIDSTYVEMAYEIDNIILNAIDKYCSR